MTTFMAVGAMVPAAVVSPPRVAAKAKAGAPPREQPQVAKDRISKPVVPLRARPATIR